MSEYIRTNKLDTNESPIIFVKEKLIRMNVRIYICDQYIWIFEYSNIFVTLWFVTLWFKGFLKGDSRPYAVQLRINADLCASARRLTHSVQKSISLFTFNIFTLSYYLPIPTHCKNWILIAKIEYWLPKWATDWFELGYQFIEYLLGYLVSQIAQVCWIH